MRKYASPLSTLFLVAWLETNDISTSAFVCRYFLRKTVLSPDTCIDFSNSDSPTTPPIDPGDSKAICCFTRSNSLNFSCLLIAVLYTKLLTASLNVKPTPPYGLAGGIYFERTLGILRATDRPAFASRAVAPSRKNRGYRPMKIFGEREKIRFMAFLTLGQGNNRGLFMFYSVFWLSLSQL